VSLLFDRDLLDDLMTDAEVDLILATSKHNIQYLLGGYRFFFFAVMEGIGLSRYLSAVGYKRGSLDSSFYVGNPMEIWQQRTEPLWTPTVRNDAKTAAQVAEIAAELIKRRGLSSGTIGLEMPFLPADAFATLTSALPAAKFVDCVVLLEELRAVKRPDELEFIREASEGIVNSMLATLRHAKPGMTKREIADILRREETSHGLSFDYCLIAAGNEYDRGPNETRWSVGQSLSLDSGGTRNGYIGDLARMGVAGPPSPLMVELLEDVNHVQSAARSVIRAGAPGFAIHAAVGEALSGLDRARQIEFEAHGVGLISHEVPHLANPSWPYPETHRDQPLKAGMVLSIETTLRNPEVGFVKLEDTVAVTDSGYEAYGDHARGWNVVEG
jgi:Xaa-Pro aminopeptidase